MYDFHFAAPHICIIRSRLNIEFERSLTDAFLILDLGAQRVLRAYLTSGVSQHS
jgi:hypothetical protein